MDFGGAKTHPQNPMKNFPFLRKKFSSENFFLQRKAIFPLFRKKFPLGNFSRPIATKWGPVGPPQHLAEMTSKNILTNY